MMALNTVILIGCGAQAKYCREILSLSGIQISRVFDPIGGKIGGKFHDIPIEAYSKDALLAAVGKSDQVGVAVCASDTFLKDEIISSIENEVSITSAIHPACVIAKTAVIGPGAIINPGAVIQPNARVGKGVMIHANSVIEHDCQVDDYVNLAMGVILSGGVHVKDRATVFTGSVVAPNTTIGCDSVIGAGSLVLHDIADNTLAYGTPAVPIKELGRQK